VSADTWQLDERLLVVFIASGRYCGSAMHVAPAAQVNDGVLNAVAISAVGTPRLLLTAPRLYGRRLSGGRVVRTFESQALSIDAAPAAMVEADGQPIGTTPVSISLVPGALRVVVPSASSRR
jgi:diacylglycerol kinase (ATP)